MHARMRLKKYVNIYLLMVTEDIRVWNRLDGTAAGIFIFKQKLAKTSDRNLLTFINLFE